MIRLVETHFEMRLVLFLFAADAACDGETHSGLGYVKAVCFLSLKGPSGWTKVCQKRAEIHICLGKMRLARLTPRWSWQSHRG